jgi:uncharacterized coiled-coil protein SlyX
MRANPGNNLKERAMSHFFEWFFGRPWYTISGVYLFLGAVIGIFIRVLFARHLWIRHQHDTVKNVRSENCWCEPEFGSFLNGCIYGAPLLWPAIVATLVTILPFRIYIGIQRFFQRWVIRGLQGIRADVRDLDAAREELKLLTQKLLNEEHWLADASQVNRDKEAKINQLQKQISDLVDKLKEYERVKTADQRVDEKLEMSRKLLDEINNRPPEDQPLLGHLPGTWRSPA